jgi:hypothetical protein
MIGVSDLIGFIFSNFYLTSQYGIPKTREPHVQFIRGKLAVT